MMSLSYVFKVVNLKLKIYIYIFINIFDLTLLNIRCIIKFGLLQSIYLKKICLQNLYRLHVSHSQHLVF